ncbi:MAG TPA: RNA polymerase sigma factor [Intrasporangiaceae bacterium]|nr:RNA polymerase sigma factor [Intrasporangiaceae bacterium]
MTDEPGTISAMSPQERRFREVYASSADDLIRFLRRRVAPAQVEDVAAEAYLIVWRRIDELPTDLSQARAWLFGIARNCALNALRSTGRQDALAVRIADHMQPQPGSHPQERLDAIEIRLDIVTAWRRLDPVDQETLALTVFDELTSVEAGKVLGITSAAYRVRLMRARRNLRRHLDQEIPT